MNPFYIGIDLSLTNTGIVAFPSASTQKEQKLKVGDRREFSVRPDKYFTKEHKEEFFYPLSRLSYIRDEVVSCVKKLQKRPYGVAGIAIEGYAMGVGAKGRIFDIGELGGIVKVALHELNIPLIIVPPMTLKKFITGKGNASKDVVIKDLFKNYGIDTNDNNIADASGLAIMCQSFFDKSFDKGTLFKYQTEALGSVKVLKLPSRKRKIISH